MDKPFDVRKWSWMMDWCKKKGLPPANEYVWQKAEEAYSNKGEK